MNISGMNPEVYDALMKFEKKFHSEIWKWILEKSTHPYGNAPKPAQTLEILDISEDYSIFSQLLASEFNAKRLVVATRSENETAEIETPAHIELKSIPLNGNYDLSALGTYDVIILKEMLHEIEDLSAFLTSLKQNIKNDQSQIFILTRPKNPPLPLPDEAGAMWRKLAPSKDNILEELDKAGFKHGGNMELYSASIPILIDKFEWEKLIMARCFPAVRNSPKCTDKAILNFIKTRSPSMKFEEKMLLFRLWTTTEAPSGEQ